MNVNVPQETDATLDVRNIGGISDTTVDIPPGVTVLRGRNATNRTSFLQAIMAACGSDHATLKGDADEGSVELTIGDETYTRTLTRQNGTVTFSGDPYLDDPVGADLFAFLLESNEARQAVQRGDNLRDVIMEPVDTDAIQEEITQLDAEKRDLEQQLDTLDNLEQRLPTLEERRQQLQADIDEKQEELETKREELAAEEATVDETREEKAELDDKLDELRELRSRLEDVRYEIDTQQESIDQLQTEREQLRSEYDDLPESIDQDPETIATELNDLRQRKSALETELNDLQRLISFNEDMLEDADALDAVDGTESDTDVEAVTDQLLADESDSVTCWTCGTTVDRNQIEETIDRLQELYQHKLSTIQDLEDEIGDFQAKRTEIRSTRQRRENLERRLATIEADIDEREATLEDLRAERTELTEEIDALETEVEELEEQAYTEVLDLHKEVNRLELERERLESDLDDVTDEIATIEDDLEQRQQIQDQLEEVQERLTDLRTRIDQLEAQAIEEFNNHMETLLDRLAFANIERIWLERKEAQVREGRRNVEQSIFELHVVRTGESGTAYEDTVNHLSESEREVTSLVFALAGYLTHSIYEAVPFMVLDSLEALDSDRIAELVAYIREYAPYLIVALLPEDAAALDDEYTYISEI